jgi:hypothetical protein
MRINANLAILQMDDGLSRARFFIGILDIFGFEIFDINSLEQLCINFTNEKLQATFNQAVFHAAMEENAEEDVNVEVADMTEIDNQEVIELIEGKPSGILSILNEECVVPKGTDASFAEKLFAQCVTNKRLKRPLKKKDAFQISHFAGQVTYTTTGILEKNKDPVSEDLIVILKGSDEPAVRQLFTESPDEAQLMLDRKKGAKFQGVVAKFQQQLAELLAIVVRHPTFPCLNTRRLLPAGPLLARKSHHTTSSLGLLSLPPRRNRPRLTSCAASNRTFIRKSGYGRTRWYPNSSGKKPVAMWRHALNECNGAATDRLPWQLFGRDGGGARHCSRLP